MPSKSSESLMYRYICLPRYQNHLYIGIYKNIAICWVSKAPWCFLTLKSEKKGCAPFLYLVGLSWQRSNDAALHCSAVAAGKDVFLFWTKRSSSMSGSRRKNVVFCRSQNQRELSFVWVWTKGSCLSSEFGQKEVVFRLSIDERNLSFVWVWTKGSCVLSESWRKEAVFRLSLDKKKLSFVWVWTKESCLLSESWRKEAF